MFATRKRNQKICLALLFSKCFKKIFRDNFVTGIILESTGAIREIIGGKVAAVAFAGAVFGVVAGGVA